MDTLSGNSGKAFGRPEHWHFLLERRYFSDLSQAPRHSGALDLRRSDLNWRALTDFPALEEVTGEGLSADQIDFLATLPNLRRLRLYKTRLPDLSSLSRAHNLEELALMSISGLSSIEPLLALPRLRSLFIESIPKLTNLSPLRFATDLRCLCISSASEHPQKIEDLSFLAGMRSLRHLMLGNIRHLGASPAFTGLSSLPELASLTVYPAFMPLEDFVYLQVRLGHIDGVEARTYIIHCRGQKDVPLTDLDHMPPELNVSVDFAGKGERGFYGPVKRAKLVVEQHLARVAAFQLRYQARD